MADTLGVKIDVKLGVEEGEVKNLKAKLESEKLTIPVDLDVKDTKKLDKTLSSAQQKAQKLTGWIKDLVASIPQIDKGLAKYDFQNRRIRDIKSGVRSRFKTEQDELLDHLQLLESPDVTAKQLKAAQDAMRRARADIYRANSLKEIYDAGKLLAEGDKLLKNTTVSDEERQKLKKNLAEIRRDYNSFLDSIEARANRMETGEEEFYGIRPDEFSAIANIRKKLDKIPQQIAIAASIQPQIDAGAMEDAVNAATGSIQPKPIAIPVKLVVDDGGTDSNAKTTINSLLEEASGEFSGENLEKVLGRDKRFSVDYGVYQKDYEAIVQSIWKKTSDKGESIDDDSRQRIQNLIHDAIINRDMDKNALLKSLREKHFKDGFQVEFGDRELGKIFTFADHIQNKLAPAFAESLSRLNNEAEKIVENKVPATVKTAAKKAAVVIQHSLEERDYLNASAAGGILAPSAAVYDTSLHRGFGYGNSAVLFPAEHFDPMLNPHTYLFGNDAWTPVVPGVKTDKNGKQFLPNPVTGKFDVPFSAENAVQIMRQGPFTDLPGQYGNKFREPTDFDDVEEQLEQAFVKRYSNFDELLADAGRLANAANSDATNWDSYIIAQRDDFKKRYKEIQDDLRSQMGKEIIDSVDPEIFRAITDGIASDTSPMSADDNQFVSSVKQSLEKNNIAFNDAVIQKLVGLRKDMADNMVEYFEAKSLDVMDINKAGAAIVPTTTDKRAIDDLKKRNIPVYQYEYDDSSEEAEAASIERFNEAVQRAVIEHPELDISQYRTKLPPIISSGESEEEKKQRERASDIMARFMGGASTTATPKIDSSEIENANNAANQLTGALKNIESDETRVPVNSDEIKNADEKAKQLLALPAPQYEELPAYKKPSQTAKNDVNAIYNWPTSEQALDQIWKKMNNPAPQVPFIPSGGKSLQELVEGYRSSFDAPKLTASVESTLENAVGGSTVSTSVGVNIEPNINVDNPKSVKDKVEKTIENTVNAGGGTKVDANVEVESNVKISDPHGMMDIIKSEIEKNKKIVDDLSEMPASVIDKRKLDNRVGNLQQNIKQLEHLQNVLQQTGNMLPDNYASILLESEKLQSKAFKNLNLEGFVANSNKIKEAFSSASEAVGSLKGSYDFTGLFDKASTSLDEYSRKYQEVVDLAQQGNLTGEHIAELNKAYAQAARDVETYVKAVTKAAEAEQKQERASKRNQAAMDTAQAKIQEMLELQTKYEKAFKDPAWARSYNEILAGYRAISPDTDDAAGKVASLNKQLAGLKAQARAAGTATTTFATSLEKAFGRFGQWFSASEIFMFIVNKMKEMIQNVKEIDTAMTDLRKVTDASEGAYDKYLTSAAQRSADMSARITDYISGTNQFARLGYGIEDAQTLGEVAMIYAQVGDDIDGIEDASGSIIATMKAFDIEAENAMSIVDKFNKAGNAYAVSSGDIGAMLQRSAAAMASAGNDINQTIAMGTAMAEVNRDAEKSGAALKVLALRLRGSKTELEEMGEGTDDMAVSTSKLREQIMALTNIDGSGGFDIMDADGFKSTYEMLDGIAKAFNQMDDGSENAAALLELIAGKNRASDVAGMLKNWETAKEVYQDMLNAEGSAMDEYTKWQKSIEAKSEKLGSNFERMSTAVFDTEVLSAAYDLLNGILSIFSAIAETAGGIPTLVGLVFGAIAKFKPDSGIVKVQYAPPMKTSLAA